MRILAILLLSVSVARAEGQDRPGIFDYWVLSLSWSPGWCAREGTARGAPQCAPDRDLGWMLHGLWPQYARGWPSWCDAPHAPPGRAETEAMADIMGSAGLARHQWRKHGSCSGLSPEAYFALSRRAYGSVTRPDLFRRLDRPATLPASVVEEAFIAANPRLAPDMITITCRDGRIQEARLCLSRDMQPVPCGADVVRDCRLSDALLDPVP